SGKQDRLAAALQKFTASLDALQPPVDYQAAVTTTTISERLGACGPSGDPNAASQCDSEWQAGGFSCDSAFACFRSFPSARPLHDGIFKRSNYSATDFAANLAAGVKVGIDGSRQPQGMGAMKKAVQQPGFLRDGAKLVVAFFTDAEDCSDPAHRLSMLVKDPATDNVIDKCAQEHRAGLSVAPSLEPVSNYANFLRGLRNLDGSPKEVEIGSVVSLTDGTQDPGLCANAACDSACDAPPAVSA